MRSVVRAVLTGLVGLLLLGSVALSVLREIDSSARLPAMAASFASYALLGYAAGLALALALRRGAARRRGPLLLGALVATVGLVVQVIWTAPLFVADRAGPSDRVDLTVMNLNLQFGAAEPDAVVRATHNEGVDVLVVEEATPEEDRALRSAGLTRLLPHTAGTPAPDASGTMVFSRFALSDSAVAPVSHGGLEVSVAAPKPFRLLAVHPAQPLNAPRDWHDDLTTVRDLAARRVRTGPTLVVGDLNATRDHAAFRSILGVGLTDAAEQAGSGWQPTWPESIPDSGPRQVARGTWLRPLIAIDHVLVSRQLEAVATTTFPVAGSDHRALVARLHQG